MRLMHISKRCTGGFDQVPSDDQEAVPSWFGDMMDTVSDDWED